VHTKHEFSPPEPFLRFSQRTRPMYYFRSKTHVWGGFAQFRCCTSPIRKNGCRGAYKARVFATGTISSFSKTHVWGGFAQFRCRTSPIPKTGVGVHTKHVFLPPDPFCRFLQRTCPIHYFRSKTHVSVVSCNFIAARHPFRKWLSGCIQSTSFCHRNHFFVLRNEHAQSTTLGPKLMFGVVSRNFVAARHPSRKRVSGCIQSRSFRQRNHFFVFHNEHAQSTTLGPKLMFAVVSRNFVVARHPFRKRVSGCKQSTSFRHRNHFFVLRNEHAQSTTLGPKLMFGVVSRNFRCRTSPIPKTGVGVHTKHEFSPTEPSLRFSQRTCPIHYFRSKTHVWGGFAQFSLPHVTHSENGCRGAYKA
jgi:hypothetical protein